MLAGWAWVAVASAVFSGCASSGGSRPCTAGPAAQPESNAEAVLRTEAASCPPTRTQPAASYAGWQKGPAPDGSLPAGAFREFVRAHRPELRHDPWRAAEVATGISGADATQVRMALSKRAGPATDAPLSPEGASHITVEVTAEGLLDDAIAATHHELVFAATQDGAWRLESARLTCRSARPGAPRTFTAAACFGP